MPETLGQGENRCSVFARGGSVELLPIDKAASIEWGRVLSSPSIAKVTVQAKADCFADLGKVNPWAHELVVFRDGIRVWEGPIRLPTFTSTAVQLEAVDVAGWMARRKVQARRTTDDHPITDEGRLCVERAFADDDPNVLDYLQVVEGADAVQLTRDLKRNSGYYLDDLNTLAGQGLRWTTVGRRILVWSDDAIIGQTSMVVPERDMVTEVSVQVMGDDLATRVTAVNSDGLASTVAVQSSTPNPDGTLSGVTEFYGLHDMIADGSDVKKLPGLRRVARRQLGPRYPAPELVTVPDGSRVNCDAKLPIEHLVAGAVVPVESKATVRRVSATMILTELKVTQTPGDGEVVTVSLAPANDLSLVET